MTPTPINALASARHALAEMHDVNERLMQLTETYLGLVAGADSVETTGNELRIHLKPHIPLRHLEAFGNAVNAMNAGEPVLVECTSAAAAVSS